MTLIAQIMAARSEIRVELYRLAHHQNLPEAWVRAETLPARCWTSHPEFALLHEQHNTLGEALKALVR